MYIVIAVGDEAIDKIFWAGPSADEAKQKTLTCRQRLTEVNALPGGERYKTDGPWMFLHDPARICVQKQMDDDRFECCCQELSVSVGGGPYLY